MNDNINKKIKDEARLSLENDGIIIETINAREELEDNLNLPQTKEEEKELFDTIGVEMYKPEKKENDPEIKEIKDNLNKEGIELLPSEPTEEDNVLES